MENKVLQLDWPRSTNIPLRYKNFFIKVLLCCPYVIYYKEQSFYSSYNFPGKHFIITMAP